MVQGTRTPLTPLGEEHSDVASSSDLYARRFAGDVGAWFLEVQGRATMALLAHLPAGARVLDVGGGHGQLTPYLLARGFDVTVVGSAPECVRRVQSHLGPRCRFEVAPLLQLPYADGEFDAVLSFRMLGHVQRWQSFTAELCRVADQSVVLDYATTRSFNAFATPLFRLKRKAEGDTRSFAVFSDRQIDGLFAALGFQVAAETAQYFLPMVVHRMHRSLAIARALEGPARATGLTRRLGSPVIVRADRRPAE